MDQNRQCAALCWKLCGGGVQKFAAGLLDVVDNLERAMESVPKEVLTQGVDPETGKPISADRALSILRSFVDGIKLTYDIFVKVSSCPCLACMRSEVRKQHSARPLKLQYPM